MQLRELTWWIVALPEERRYDEFEIRRRSGGTPRRISAPIKPLKDIQRQLADHLLAWYAPPPHVHGFVAGRSPTSNARAHRRQEWVLRVDLEDFFPTINFGRVRGLFMAFPFEYPADVATLLAQICCHRNGLPQGAPTSPIVSNYICRGLDSKLGRIAASERCYYTRYADDICLSTDRSRFPARLATLKDGRAVASQTLADVIEENGFSLQKEKTRLAHRTQRQRVTGLVVNSKVNVSRDYVRDLRNLLFIWRAHGEDAAIAAWQKHGGGRNRPPGKPTAPFNQIVRGRVQHVGAIKGLTSSVYVKLAASLREVDPTFKPRSPLPVVDLAQAQAVKLFTEGESDLPHMLAAQRYFHAKGEFTGFRLEDTDKSAKRGDLKLLEHCRGLSLTRQAAPSLCLFDRDNEAVLRDAVGEGDWKDWGNGVVAVALVGRGAGRLCIEMLHDESTREIQDEDGRRMFLTSEFDERTGHHHTRRYTTPHPRNPRSGKLVPDEVHDFQTGDSVLLSKRAFAEAVSEGKGEYADLDFEGFRVTFETIRDAVRAAVAGTRPGGT
ncbi:MAG TPA: reverse transcriptase domain-containing protein [Solirubrobacterales bacterium]